MECTNKGEGVSSNPPKHLCDKACACSSRPQCKVWSNKKKTKNQKCSEAAAAASKKGAICLRLIRAVGTEQS